MSNDSSSPDSNQRFAAPWRGSQAVLGVIAAFLLAQGIGGFLITLYPEIQGWSQEQANTWLSDSISAQFWYVLIAQAITLAVLWLFWRQYPALQVRKALGFARRIQLKDFGYAFLGVVAYFAAYIMLLTAINSFVPVNVDQEQAVGFDAAAGLGLLAAFVSLVVLPPIVEEITFRGFLYSGLKRRMGIAGGMLFTSLIFAAPHLLTGKDGLLWVAMIDTFALSLVLCYLRDKTGALYAPIAVHATKNAIAFVSLFVIHIS